MHTIFSLTLNNDLEYHQNSYICTILALIQTKDHTIAWEWYMVWGISLVNIIYGQIICQIEDSDLEKSNMTFNIASRSNLIASIDSTYLISYRSLIHLYQFKWIFSGVMVNFVKFGGAPEGVTCNPQEKWVRSWKKNWRCLVLGSVWSKWPK